MDVTVHLLWLGTAIAGWLVGLCTSTFLQDREHIRRQRGAVGVLISEVDRLSMEIGGATDEWIDIGVLGGRATIPEIHPWIHASVIEIAHSDPSVVRQFMEVDRCLHNQRLFVNTLRQIKDEVRAARRREGGAKQPSSESGYIDDITQSVLARLSAKQEMQQREQTVSEAVRIVNLNHRHIVAALAKLHASLGELDSILREQPSFNLRRLLGVRVALLRDEPH